MPVFGIIYAPALAAPFATLGARPRRRGRPSPPDVAGVGLADCELTPLHTRAARPALRSLPSPAARTPAKARTRSCSRLPIAEKRKASSSLKFCLIARGEADLYARLGQTSEWDTAAGHAILAAAGGSVTTLDG